MNGTARPGERRPRHSPTLGKFFEDYTTARLTGNFTFDALAGVLPKTQGSIVVGSVDTAHISPVTLAVNHLAVRYVDFAHGLDTDTGPCFSAWLDLKVTLPAGVATTPYYSANVKDSAPQAFTVSGNTATLNDIPWNTCGASPHAYVSLPNESNDVAPPRPRRPRIFRLGHGHGRQERPASATEAPAGVKITGPVIQTPPSDPAPELTLYAPELIRVSAKTRLAPLHRLLERRRNVEGDARLDVARLGRPARRQQRRALTSCRRGCSTASARPTPRRTSSCSRAIHRAAHKVRASPAASR